MQTSHQHPVGQPVLAGQSVTAQEEVPLREQLSALVDGECDERDWDRLARACTDLSELKQAWAQYHCISAALRSPHQAAPVASPDFLAGVMARVAQESARPLVPAPMAVHPVPAAANDAVFRWKMVAGCASLAAVAAVAWQLVATAAVAPTGPQWAQNSAPVVDPVQVVVTPSGAVMLRDAQLDEFMAAHRQWGGMSALQMPTGFLRNATYETTQY